jgi:hypothetical protein
MNDAMSSDEHVQQLLGEIREFGYQLQIVVEAKIALIAKDRETETPENLSAQTFKELLKTEEGDADREDRLEDEDHSTSTWSFKSTGSAKKPMMRLSHSDRTFLQSLKIDPGLSDDLHTY